MSVNYLNRNDHITYKLYQFNNNMSNEFNNEEAVPMIDAESTADEQFVDTSINVKSVLQKTKDGIKSFFHMNSDISKDLKTANESFLLASIGKIATDEERTKEFIKSMAELIESKSKFSEYSCTREIPEDLTDYIPEILKVFKEKGYIAVNLNEKLSEIKRNYLFLCWDKFNTKKD